MTDAEQALWRLLRGRQVSGLKFRRQHPFGDYILDFVCLENGLVVEVDGGQHAEQVEYDEVRSNQLEKAGFYVLRFWNNEVLLDMEAVKEKIWLTVEELGLQPQIRPHPHPNLPLEGEGTKSTASLEGEENKSTAFLEGEENKSSKLVLIPFEGWKASSSPDKGRSGGVVL